MLSDIDCPYEYCDTLLAGSATFHSNVESGSSLMDSFAERGFETRVLEACHMFTLA